MKIGNIIILPWDRKNFIPRIIAICLILGWVTVMGVVACESMRLKTLLRQQQEQQMRVEEQQRREAAYKQRMIQEQRIRGGVQNVVDGFKR